ncbi:DUF4062 domain-containing protein [Arthrobacter zhaoguopingii]|uniref:DUF4062 domain-containing protein n=1 Tax=Arthrobacter zhaoguopingii TaxID=2681491 RepID=UPI001357860E|nr:DUF4062 domain-containing protein [Arthrobacter zhaoguopingii]
MAFSATAIVVLIASPGDTADERAAIQQQVSKWNVSRAEREGVVAMPWLYEQHAVPVLGGHPQSVINAQAVDRSEIVIAFFDSRLGTETPEAVSGTAEEIKRAHKAGKSVHVYFSTEDLPRSVDADQLKKLAKFKETLKAEGLLGSYSSPENLASQVHAALDYDVSSNQWAPSPTAPASAPSGAELSARHEYQREANGQDTRGRPRYRILMNDLVIENRGNTTASNIDITVDEIDGHFMFEKPEPFDLPPNSEVQFSLIGIRSGNARVTMTWNEDGEPKQHVQLIRVRASA